MYYRFDPSLPRHYHYHYHCEITGGPNNQSVWGVQLHVAILSKCMGNSNFSYNISKNNKIGRLPRVSRVVVTLCVYGRFWSGLDAN